MERAECGLQAWSKVASAMVVQGCTIGLQYSFGIIFVVLLDAFGSSRADTAWIGALSTGLMEISAVLAGLVVSKTSARFCVLLGGALSGCGLLLSSFATELWHLYFSFGVLVGVGHALMFPVLIFVLNSWFDKRKALANGVGTTGAGLGTLIWGPLTEGLVNHVGWRTTFRVLSLASVLAIVAAMNYRTPAEVKDGCNCRWLTHPYSAAPEKVTPEKSSIASEDSSWRTLLRVAGLKRYLLGSFFYGWGFWIPVIHTARFALDCDLPSSSVAMITSSIGMGSLCGRIPLSLLADYYGRLNMFRCVLLFYSLTTACLCVAAHMMPLPLWMAYGCVCGACCGTLMALTGVVAADIMTGLDPRLLMLALPSGFTAVGTGVTFGPALAGFLFDTVGTYDYAYAFAASTMGLGALLLMLPVRCFGGNACDAPLHVETVDKLPSDAGNAA